MLKWNWTINILCICVYYTLNLRLGKLSTGYYYQNLLYIHILFKNFRRVINFMDIKIRFQFSILMKFWVKYLINQHFTVWLQRWTVFWTLNIKTRAVINYIPSYIINSFPFRKLETCTRLNIHISDIVEQP